MSRANEVVTKKMLSATSAQLRLFKRERVDEIVNCVWDKLMARLMPYFDTQVSKNIFNMNIGVLYMR